MCCAKRWRVPVPIHPRPQGQLEASASVSEGGKTLHTALPCQLPRDRRSWKAEVFSYPQNHTIFLPILLHCLWIKSSHTDFLGIFRKQSQGHQILCSSATLRSSEKQLYLPVVVAPSASLLSGRIPISTDFCTLQNVWVSQITAVYSIRYQNFNFHISAQRTGFMKPQQRYRTALLVPVVEIWRKESFGLL